MNKRLILEKTYDKSRSRAPKLTVVLIHGIASDSGTYKGLLRYLEKDARFKKARFVTFDLLGSGKSLKDDNLNYDYNDQIEALHNSIIDLEMTTPLVLVGHSLGTFIVTKYAAIYKNAVSHLILVSPPIYTLTDMENPAFALGIKAFENAVSVKSRDILKEKSFRNSMEKIVLNKKNYQTLVDTKTPTTLIYGDADQLIASYNVPKLLKENSNISAIKTIGRHGVSRDKYSKIAGTLEGVLSA